MRWPRRARSSSVSRACSAGTARGARRCCARSSRATRTRSPRAWRSPTCARRAATGTRRSSSRRAPSRSRASRAAPTRSPRRRRPSPSCARSVLRRLPPHLALPVRLVMPTYGRAGHAKLGLGLWTFERIATVAPEERHAMWSREEALEREPTLDGTRLHGAATFVEYLTCDARLVLETVLGAHAAGALCVNHVEATEIAGGAVALRDTLTGRALHARSAVVVNAAGPWGDEVRRRAGALAGVRLHLTRGIHLVVPHGRLPVRHIVVMQARDRRSVFAVPR